VTLATTSGGQARRSDRAEPTGLGRGICEEGEFTVMAGDRGRVLLLMLAAVVALSLGETALARGMKQTAHVGQGWFAQVMAVLGNRWVVAGAILLAIHFGLYLAALRYADLSFALPLTAAAYPLSALLARYYLREDVGTARWIGTLLITAGVAIVILGEWSADD
jgi:drug/metabolite transporter (DMT)-like permease